MQSIDSSVCVGYAYNVIFTIHLDVSSISCVTEVSTSDFFRFVVNRLSNFIEWYLFYFCVVFVSNCELIFIQIFFSELLIGLSLLENINY